LYTTILNELKNRGCLQEVYRRIMGQEDVEKFRWKKGESGNPKGRKKGSKNRSTIARELLALTFKGVNPVTGEQVEMSAEQLITLAQMKKALDNGDTNAYKALLDSAFGAPTQVVEQTNIDKTPPKIEWTDPGQ